MDRMVAEIGEDSSGRTMHPQGREALEEAYRRVVLGDGSIPPPSWLASCDTVAGSGARPALGVAVAGVPVDWHWPLLLAGVPLAAAGSLQWERDLAPGAGACCRQEGERLLLPGTPEDLAAADGVALKPLRRWLGERIGLRLQAAPGIGMLVWPHRVLLISTHLLPLAGFLHGPAKGQRHILSFEPGQILAIDLL